MVKESKNSNMNIEEMAEHGLQFGHKTSRAHPKMRPFILGEKNKVNIIDLEKTKEKIKEALEFIQSFVSEGKTLLLVGTKIQVKGLVEEIAKECNLPYVSERWLGGTLTNFETVKKRIKYFKDLKNQKATGELEKYTKKERLKIDKEIKKLTLKFGGIENLEEIPEALFVVDIKDDEICVKEAKKKKVAVIAITDTNVDPTLVDFPIPASDDSISSVKYILEKVKQVILEAKTKKPKVSS